MDLCASTFGPAGRVLVIDDEDGIRRVLKRVLQEHEVVTACDGDEGLCALRTARDPFDVVLCDVVMPGMGGVAFGHAVAQEFPRILPRLVFMSGGWISPADARFLAGYQGAVVEKPFRIAGMRALVRDRIGLHRACARAETAQSLTPRSRPSNA